MPLTEKELAEIEQRTEKATPGPWSAVEHGNTIKSHAIVAVNKDISIVPIAAGISPKTENATFIAHSRTDIPTLLAEIRRLQEENRWIPVTEDTPDGECIATCLIPGMYGYGEMIIGYVSNSQNSETGYIAESESEILQNVTHWRPKPKPTEDTTNV